MNPSTALRPVNASDLNFIFDTWMKTWRESKWAGTIPNHLFYDTQRKLIEDLLIRGARIVVAHEEHDHSRILGWACGETKEGKTVLHYVYTRRKDDGLTAALVDGLLGAKPGFITHKIPGKKFKAWKHLPELARRKNL